MHVDDDDDDDDDDDGGNPTRKPCIIIITSFLAGDLEPKVALAGSRAVMNLPPVTVSRPEKISPHPCPLDGTNSTTAIELWLLSLPNSRSFARSLARSLARSFASSPPVTRPEKYRLIRVHSMVLSSYNCTVALDHPHRSRAPPVLL